MSLRSRALLVIAFGAALVAVGIAVAVDNPSIGNTDAGTYRCFAPYDAILLGSRNNVGQHADAEDIEDRCYAADRDRFVWAGLAAGAGILVMGGGWLVHLRRSRAA